MPKRESQSPSCDFGLYLRNLVLAVRLNLVKSWGVEARDVATVEREVWLLERELMVSVWLELVVEWGIRSQDPSWRKSAI